MLIRWFALFCWSWGIWTLLTWTRTAEQVGIGALLAAITALVCAPLGPAGGPWRLLPPRRLAALAALLAVTSVRLVRANLSLSRRIWSRHPPLRSGMVIVPTLARTDGELTAVTILTSLVVDSQLVDVDRARHEAQYHVVWIDDPSPAANRRHINAPVERLLLKVTRRGRPLGAPRGGGPTARAAR